MNERNLLLDSLKGFAILLVVLGHSIQSAQSDFDTNVLFRIIYSFHMPLFMFISGFVSFGTFDGSVKKLTQRLQSLMIPFWAWFFFSFAFYSAISFFNGSPTPHLVDSLISVIKYPDVGLWFLWVLFLAHLVLFLSIRISPSKPEVIVFLFFIAINILKNLTGFNYLGIELLSWHLLFYLIGYVTNKYISGLRKLLYTCGIISLLCFPVLILFWSKTGNPAFSESLEVAQPLKSALVYFYRLAVPLTGIFASYTLFGWLLPFFTRRNAFQTLGGLTIEIYATHGYFFSLIFVVQFFSLPLQICLLFLIALSGSLLAQYAIKRNHYLSWIFFGKIRVDRKNT